MKKPKYVYVLMPDYGYDGQGYPEAVFVDGKTLRQDLIEFFKSSRHDWNEKFISRLVTKHAATIDYEDWIIAKIEVS